MFCLKKGTLLTQGRKIIWVIKMKELRWMLGWSLGVYDLDKHNKNVCKIINKLICISSDHEEDGYSLQLSEVIEGEFLPYLDDFSFEVIDILNIFETHVERKQGGQYRLYKKDYLDSISDLISYIRGFRINPVADFICIGEIRNWFIVYMMRIKLLMAFGRDLNCACSENNMC